MTFIFSISCSLDLSQIIVYRRVDLFQCGLNVRIREQHGIEIEKNKIVQADPIKAFGSYTVKAKLGYEISGNINVLVIEDR